MTDDASDEDTMYCISCGEEIPVDASFCPNCGSFIGEAEDTDSEPSQTTTSRTDPGEDTPETSGDSPELATIGHLLAWGGAILFTAAGLGLLLSGTPRSFIAGLVSFCLGIGFLPPLRSNLDLPIPGVEAQHQPRRRILTGVAYGIGGVFLVGALAPNGPGGTDGPGSAESNQYPNAWYYDESSEIVIWSADGSAGTYTVEITGEASNEGTQEYSYVQLSFGLYDASGAKVGDALANVSGLGAGQRWRYEAIGTGSDVDTFNIESVTAY